MECLIPSTLSINENVKIMVEYQGARSNSLSLQILLNPVIKVVETDIQFIGFMSSNILIKGDHFITLAQFSSTCIIDDQESILTIVSDHEASCPAPLSKNTGIHTFRIKTSYGEIIENG